MPAAVGKSPLPAPCCVTVNQELGECLERGEYSRSRQSERVSPTGPDTTFVGGGIFVLETLFELKLLLIGSEQ